MRLRIVLPGVIALLMASGACDGAGGTESPEGETPLDAVAPVLVRISPDGARTALIAFEDAAVGGDRIVVVVEDGRERHHKLTGVPIDAAWFDDSADLLVAVSAGSGDALLRLSTISGEVRTLDLDLGVCFGNGMSIDQSGATLVAAVTEGECDLIDTPSLVTIDLASGAIESIPTDRAATDPHIDRDGRIVFLSGGQLTDDEPRQVVALTNADTGEVEALTPPDQWVSDLAVSRGGRIVFRGVPDGLSAPPQGLYVMEANGETTPLSGEGLLSYPSLSADGSQLAAVRVTNLAAVLVIDRI